MRNKTGHESVPYAILAYGIPFALAIGIDQWVKYLVRHHLAGKESIWLLQDLLSLTYVENRGGAFGLLSGKLWLLTLIPMLLCIGILVFLLLGKAPKGTAGPLVLITAGGIGNLLDRLVLGYVTDMISVSFFPPVFNIADICVTLGCGWLILWLLRSDSEVKRERN